MVFLLNLVLSVNAESPTIFEPYQTIENCDQLYYHVKDIHIVLPRDCVDIQHVGLSSDQQLFHILWSVPGETEAEKRQPWKISVYDATSLKLNFTVDASYYMGNGGYTLDWVYNDNLAFTHGCGTHCLQSWYVDMKTESLRPVLNGSCWQDFSPNQRYMIGFCLMGTRIGTPISIFDFATRKVILTSEDLYMQEADFSWQLNQVEVRYLDSRDQSTKETVLKWK